jgi:hypothetical protein
MRRSQDIAVQVAKHARISLVCFKLFACRHSACFGFAYGLSRKAFPLMNAFINKAWRPINFKPRFKFGLKLRSLLSSTLPAVIPMTIENSAAPLFVGDMHSFWFELPAMGCKVKSNSCVKHHSSRWSSSKKSTELHQQPH